MLAIRITNPFGRFDWVDGLNAQWGAVKLFRSHGFGGLDRGMTISAHTGSVRISDLWVLNDTKPKTIYVRAVTQNTSGSPAKGFLRHQVLDPETGKPLRSMNSEPAVITLSSLEHDAGMTPSKGETWDLDQTETLLTGNDVAR